MRPKTRALALALTVVAAIQATVLVVLRLDDASPAQPPSLPSADLSRVLATDAEGRQQQLAAMGPLLVLVFDPECVHTRRVAPLWHDWLRHADPSLRIVALSASRQATASAYATAVGWPVPVLTVQADAASGPETSVWAVVRRSPWVFAVSANGRAVAAGPGNRVSQVADALWTAMGSG